MERPARWRGKRDSGLTGSFRGNKRAHMNEVSICLTKDNAFLNKMSDGGYLQDADREYLTTKA